MQKILTQKAFLLVTLLFICIAAFSFAAFRETEDVCSSAKEACKAMKTVQQNDILWEVVSRQFLSLVSL